MDLEPVSMLLDKLYPENKLGIDFKTRRKNKSLRPVSTIKTKAFRFIFVIEIFTKYIRIRW